MNLLALDLSLSTIGMADNLGGSPACYVADVPKKLRGVERLAWIRSRVLMSAIRHDLVLIEGYAFARANQAHQIGELGGVIRMALVDAEIPWLALTPSTVKKLATSKGNAGKEQVLVEAVKRLGYDGHDNNASDALWLLQAALIHYGLPGAVTLPKAHLKALDAVTWPERAEITEAA